MVNKQLTKLQKGLLAGLFLVFLLVGLFSSNDYGIAWDEPNQLEIGKHNYEYLLGKSDSLVTYHDRHYGSAYEMPLYALQKAFELNNKSSIYNFRHLVNHMVFIVGLGFFFVLLLKLFKNFNAAILGTIVLYIHPRIFAHSFFNSKDIIFMSIFIIGLYTLYLLVEKQNIKRIIIHALVTALLIDTRILGVILPFLSLLVMFPSLIASKNERSQTLKSFSLYSILLIIFIYAFWPALWTDPLLVGKSFARMSQFPFRYDILFQGSLIPAREVAWTYIPIWIGISTPPFILLLFMIGFMWIIYDYFKNPENAFTINSNWYILVLASFPFDFTIILILLNSTLYDGWRQVFFLYPLIVISAVYAYVKLSERLKNKQIGWYIVNSFIIIFMLLTALKIYKLHPYEQVYFNHFVSKENENRRKSFEMDYWGLSYREGLEFVMRSDSSKIIKINFANAAGPNNILYLTAKDQKRIQVVDKPEQSDYFITNYRYHPEDYQYKNEVYKVERDGNRILSVFKMNK